MSLSSNELHTPWWRRLAYSIFFTEPDDALAAEWARNQEAQVKLASTLTQVREVSESCKDKVNALDENIRQLRQEYANKGKSLLEKFEDISIADHQYQEIRDMVKGQASMMEFLSSRELSHFGYISKKLISLSLHYNALLQKLKNGTAFANELSATVRDAESEDIKLMSLPLTAFAQSGIPSSAEVRLCAYDLSSIIAKSGKEFTRESFHGWLDMLKFTTAVNPSKVAENRVVAWRRSLEFNSHIEKDNYTEAVQLAEAALQTARQSHDSVLPELEKAYANFLRVVTPAVASAIFASYTQSTLAAARYACARDALKNEESEEYHKKKQELCEHRKFLQHIQRVVNNKI